jgi:hypothetical protein
MRARLAVVTALAGVFIGAIVIAKLAARAEHLAVVHFEP